MSRVLLEPAYVLHRRPYSNTSLILDLFTQQYGRLSVLARSARGLKSRYKGTLELFSPLLLSWSGRGELKTLGHAERTGVTHALSGNALLCGFYLNELLVRFLHRDDPHFYLFSRYEQALKDLQYLCQPNITLRYFEKHLLSELGYGLPLQREAGTGLPIEADLSYHCVPERGFFHQPVKQEGVLLVSGRSLIAFREECLEDEADVQAIKRLMRSVLAHHLSGKSIKSRLLFSS